jgi:HAMP domain-containing protein
VSFRTRLTSFFVVIVVVPMIAFGFMVFRLIGQGEDGKADARANGLATAAAIIYQRESAAGKADAATVARNVASLHGAALQARLHSLFVRAGLARITVSNGSRAVVDIGARDAVAPGAATITGRRGPGVTSVTVSEVRAPEYARQLVAPGAAVIVRQGPRTLASTVPVRPNQALPRQGTVSVRGSDYRGATQAFRGFGGTPVEVTVLSNVAATAASVGSSRILAAVLIAAFLLLAAAFALLASRALHGQLGRFLEAARRVGSGDFSSRVPVEGHDEFAALGEEFNQMSGQLAQRIDELGQERARLREAIRRIRETFAANLDRPALLELALRTAVDAVEGDCGRLSTRLTAQQPLSESARVGSLSGFEEQLLEAERAALARRGLGRRAPRTSTSRRSRSDRSRTPGQPIAS